MKSITTLSMDDALSLKILDAAIEIKKNTPDKPFLLILEDLVEGVRKNFQVDEA